MLGCKVPEVRCLITNRIPQNDKKGQGKSGRGLWKMEKGQREFFSLPFWCDPVLSLFLFLPVDCGTEDGQRSKDDGGDGEV